MVNMFRNKMKVEWNETEVLLANGLINECIATGEGE